MNGRHTVWTIKKRNQMQKKDCKGQNELNCGTKTSN